VNGSRHGAEGTHLRLAREMFLSFLHLRKKIGDVMYIYRGTPYKTIDKDKQPKKEQVRVYRGVKYTQTSK
jgi:hypothetical protein